MKKWERFEKFLTKGDWHVHTDYVDSEDSIVQLCAQAEKNDLQLIAFTEHVRKKMDYNFENLVSDVEKARKIFPNLKILIGCEAKVLLNGEIDVSDEILKLCDIVIASFHVFPPVKEEQTNALKRMLKNPHVDIWGHPGTLLSNCELSREEMKNIINLCIKNKVLIEISLKYAVTPDFIELVEKMNAKTVIGSDAHSVWELRKIV